MPPPAALLSLAVHPGGTRARPGPGPSLGEEREGWTARQAGARARV